MFTRFVYALLSFRAREFPAKSETQEPREIIVEFLVYYILYNLYYVYMGSPADLIIYYRESIS